MNQNEQFRGAWILTGPTGAGKSALALELAELANAEILALDSMTVYREMNIGTAKPSVADQARVPHHLLDLLDPWESGDVAWWLRQAEQSCHAIRQRGKRPLFVGGTPFYLKALTSGLFSGPTVNPELRVRLEAEALAENGKITLHQRLQQVDPVAAARLHPNDIRRVVRALEVYEQTGKPLSEQQTNWGGDHFGGSQAPEPLPLPTVILHWPREQLHPRIDARIDAMLAAGWLDEAERLLNLEKPLSRQASQALGYQELFAVLRGKSCLAQARDQIQIKTKQFSKRQRTWFRSLKSAILLDLAAGISAASILSVFHKLEKVDARIHI